MMAGRHYSSVGIDTPLHREQHDAEAPRKVSPDPLRGKQHGRDRKSSEQDEVPAAEAREGGLHQVEDQNADDGALQGPDAPDHNNKDYVGVPIENPERRIGRDTRLLQLDDLAP